MFLVNKLEVKDGSITTYHPMLYCWFSFFFFFLFFFFGTVHQYLIEAFLKKKNKKRIKIKSLFLSILYLGESVKFPDPQSPTRQAFLSP